MKKLFSKVKSIIANVQTKIKGWLFKHEKINRILVLTKMQEKNKRKLVKQLKFTDKLIINIGKVLLFVGMFFAFRYGLVFFIFFTKMDTIQYALKIPGNWSTFVVFIYLSVSIMSLSISFINTMYRSKDNALLLSYPVNTSDIYISKLLVSLKAEFRKSLYLFLPYMIAVFIYFRNDTLIYKLSDLYVFWTIVLTVLIPFIIVLISGILSILFTYLDVLFKKINTIKVIFFTLMAIGVSVLFIVIVNKLPLHLPITDLWFSMIESVTKFINKLMKVTFFSYSIVLLPMRSNILSLLLILGVLILAALINVFGCYRLFYTLVYKPLKDKPISLSHKSSNRRSKNIFFIFLRKEFKTYLRSNDGFITSLIYIIVLPIILYCLNRVFASFNISSRGSVMIMSINMIISIILISASNISVANAISKEGSEFYLLKVTPIDSKQIAFAKLFVNMLLTLFAVIGSFIAILCINKFTGIEIVSLGNLFVMCIVVLFASLSHILWSMELDIVNCHAKEYAEGQKENKNMTISVFIGIGLALVIGLVYFLFNNFMLSVYGFNPLPQVSITILATLVLVSRIYLFIKKLNAYFDEISI